MAGCVEYRLNAHSMESMAWMREKNGLFGMFLNAYLLEYLHCGENIFFSFEKVKVIVCRTKTNINKLLNVQSFLRSFYFRETKPFN